MRRRDFIGGSALALALDGAKAAVPAPQTSCILLMMVGGVSHLDTFDPKPEAPSEIRSPFRAIGTTVPEMQISELFPKLARQAKRFSLIRNMHHPEQLLHDEGLALAQPKLPGGVVLNPGADTTFAENCNTARTLVESGVRCVTVKMFDTVFGTPSWDMHGYSPFSSFATYRDVAAPMFDAAVSKLLIDLDERGLLNTTMVVALTEFGRTPRINPTGGRDHWSRCWTSLVAGGGFEGGRIYGSSDARGEEPRDAAVTPEMLAGEIQRRLGLQAAGAAQAGPFPPMLTPTS